MASCSVQGSDVEESQAQRKAEVGMPMDSPMAAGLQKLKLS